MFTPRPPRKQSTARRGAYAERTSRRPRSTNSVRPWVLNCGSDARRGGTRSIRSRITPAETRGRLKPFPRLRLDRLQRLEEPLLPFPQLFLLLQEVERLLLQNLDPHLPVRVRERPRSLLPRAERGLPRGELLLPLRDCPREGFHDPFVGARGGQGLVLPRRGRPLGRRRPQGGRR